MFFFTFNSSRHRQHAVIVIDPLSLTMYYVEVKKESFDFSVSTQFSEILTAPPTGPVHIRSVFFLNSLSPVFKPWDCFAAILFVASRLSICFFVRITYVPDRSLFVAHTRFAWLPPPGPPIVYTSYAAVLNQSQQSQLIPPCPSTSPIR